MASIDYVELGYWKCLFEADVVSMASLGALRQDLLASETEAKLKETLMMAWTSLNVDYALLGSKW